MQIASFLALDFFFSGWGFTFYDKLSPEMKDSSQVFHGAFPYLLHTESTCSSHNYFPSPSSFTNISKDDALQGFQRCY